MRHARVLVPAALAACVLAAVALAQSTVTPIPDNEPVRTLPLEIDLGKTTWGDPVAGQAKAAVCAACHGVDGNSPIEMYPRIAGQSERYVAHQLALIANGQRSGGMVAVMLPFVQDLTAQDMRDIGAWYASQRGGSGLADDAAVADGPYAGMKFYEIGQKLYRGGDTARGIPACMACHGPSGAGNPGPAYPHVGGQYAAYVARRLQEYQAGTTQQTDPSLFEIMAQVTHALTEQEIQGLASYLQGLHDRADDDAAAAGAQQPAPAQS